ncbi:hypothetical protein LXL04_036212, partial [Taraxacum kok-saghyz]
MDQFQFRNRRFPPVPDPDPGTCKSCPPLGVVSQPFSSLTFRASITKFETSSSSYKDTTVLSDPPPPLPSAKSLPLNRFYSQTHSNQTFFIGNHRFSSQAGKESSEDEDDDLNASITDSELISEAEDDDIVVEEPQNELDLSDNEEEAVETKSKGKRGTSGLFKA